MKSSTQHGGDIYGVAQSLACDPKEIIDFSSNINPTRPEIEFSLTHEDIAHYGDNSYRKLKELIASKYSVDWEEIMLFNGISSAIFSLFGQLDFEEVNLYAPLYGEYKEAALHHGKKISLINRFEAEWQRPKAGSLVVFVNPSTPDGKFYDLGTLLKQWHALGCQVIIDESFIEFSDKASFREMIKSYDNLYLLQSFTKYYACAGLRIGALFTSRQNLRKLFTPMWPLSSADVILLSRIFEDRTHPRRSASNFEQYAQRMRRILLESDCFEKVYESCANYILVKTNRSEEVEAKLLKSKIMVRSCFNFDFLGKEYLRFAVKDDEAMDALEAALKCCSV